MALIFILVKMCLALCVLSWYSAGVLNMINHYFYSEFSKQLKKEFPKNDHLSGINGNDQCPAKIHNRDSSGPNIHHPSQANELHPDSFPEPVRDENPDGVCRARGTVEENRKIVKGRGGEYLFKPSQVDSGEIDESVRQRTSSPSYLSGIKADAAGTMTTTGSTNVGQQPPSRGKMDEELGKEEAGVALRMEPERIGEKSSIEWNKDVGERHDYVQPSLEHPDENQLFTSPYFHQDSCPAPDFHHQPLYLQSPTEQSCQQKVRHEL